MIVDWANITIIALQDTWQAIVLYLPKLFGAIVVFVIGWLIGSFVGKLIAEILKKITFNKLFDKLGWEEAWQKAELKVDPAEFVGAIFKWIIIIVFLSSAVGDVLGLKQFEIFLEEIITWLPNLLVAIAIFVVAIIITDIFEKLIKASVKRMDIGYVGFIGTIVKWSIYIFAFLAIIEQLIGSKVIINTLVSGFVGMIALAFGLAFGLGGKDAAAKFIEDLKKKIS